ncbi:MAG TPA: carbamoyl-phosphate synthase large subunit, partial [Nitrolancea sp.]|nr:carbamoyl-phosphate synthase large subunit [Nitrolancea sp.]
PAWSESDDLLWEQIRRPNDLRLWALTSAIRRGSSPEQVSQASGYDPWFTRKLRRIVGIDKMLRDDPLTDELLWTAKRSGFSDVQISELSGQTLVQIREQRYAAEITPVYKMVDTCAAEFEAATPYFYSTYGEEDEVVPLAKLSAVVVGSGPIRIGQGIEFDYCSVQAARSLGAAGRASVMINSNPETVSTDFDISDRLYFEPLDDESVFEILRHEAQINGHPEQLPPVILQFGGQTAINLAEPLSARGVPILGSSLEVIDVAENRRRFEQFLSGLDIPQPSGAAVTSFEEALAVAERIGYPVLVRPSYVLGGRAMEVVYSEEYLARYLKVAVSFNGHPILIDKYLPGKEVEVDAICDGVDVLIPGIMEHIERAGVHSGDSFATYPGVNLFPNEVEQIVEHSTKIALALGAIGLINIQYVIHAERIYVLEVNPRASRTVPFLSKATGVPMVRLATNAMLGRSLKDQGYGSGLWPRQPLVAVKAPIFSMAKLRGVEVNLGPEMKSTGEAMGIDREFAPAFYKALMAAGMALPPRGSVLISICNDDKVVALPMIEQLSSLGYRIYATEGTAAMIERAGVPVQFVPKKIGTGSPDILDIILDGTVDAIINTPGPAQKEVLDGFKIRRAAVERGIPCVTSIDTARAIVEATSKASGAYAVEPLPNYRLRVPVGE